MSTFQLSGNLIDILNQEIYPATVHISHGRIRQIVRDSQPYDQYLLPGFIDAHVHIESAMLTPAEFARLAVVHGTVGTISDPHEIANVLGVAGVNYMIANCQHTPFKCNFGAPSCVPATPFETAGAVVSVQDVKNLLAHPEIRYLSEMMNFPGVLQQQPDVMEKIAAAHKASKPVDGHAPGLRGAAAKQYIDAGISTDHECFTLEEAQDKLQYGMHILIREGSAAKNFEALIPLLHDYPEKMMFCSDDKHPDSLVEGHINVLVKRALAKGIDLFKVLRAACINPVLHYKMEVGLLREGDPADLIIINNTTDFTVKATYVNGIQVAANGQTLIEPVTAGIINNFDCRPQHVEDFRIPANGTSAAVNVIEALDGQLITNNITATLPVQNGALHSDPSQDVLKMVVVNRYFPAPAAAGFIRSFGFTKGAIASSVAHDSHNIIAVGVDDESICAAVNAVIREKGGISVVNGMEIDVLPLPVAGLMSHLDGYEVAARYSHLDKAAKALGSPLAAPFMTLSFMALLVIPHLKLSDKGLFNGDTFTFTSVIK
ncbi:Adenine deaminase [Chitinophaga rupis]|uniref:Adenine deaminase n=1 Tax=Chitinophaga rupis TaxID=573321 RepID=A0A1H8I5M0_9BACT|nr:adenine deaminase [Chitinophaga rupis]SEN63138.1 Adenine deaminase [Chitinophaga rupis]